MSRTSLVKNLEAARKEIIKKYKRKNYEYFRSVTGGHAISALLEPLSDELYKVGSRAIVSVAEGKGKRFAIMVSVIDPDGMSMMSDGFYISPDNKKIPIYDNVYDD